MIKSFKHKGLELFFMQGKSSGINFNHIKKIRSILAILNSATSPNDMNGPGLRLHKLKGSRQSEYSVTVNGNWRITFEFENENAYNVNYEDYH